MSSYTWLLVGYTLFIYLNVIDYRLTGVILQNGGKEFNPVIRWVYKTMGMKGIFYIKCLVLSPLGIAVLLNSIDIYSIYYLNFMFSVVLSLMYIDVAKMKLDVHVFGLNTTD